MSNQEDLLDADETAASEQSDETEDSAPSQVAEAASPGDEIIANALSMMEDPQISAKTLDEDGFRTGWEKLQEVFALAAPSYLKTAGWEENNLKRSNQVGTQGIPHWCGIFALWAIKKSGIEVGEWKMGSGISAVSGVRQVSDTSQLQKGDIGYLDKPFNHHFLIREVHDDGTIDTVDGNSGTSSTIAMKDGQPVSKFNAFYTVLSSS